MTPFGGGGVWQEAPIPFHIIVYFDSKMAPTTQVKQMTSKACPRDSTSSVHEDEFQC